MGALSLSGYSISSIAGNLLPDPSHTSGVGWDSLADQGLSGWLEVGNTSTNLAELNLSSSVSLNPSGSVFLGNLTQPPISYPAATSDVQWGYTLTDGTVVGSAPVRNVGGLQLIIYNLTGNNGSPIETVKGVIFNSSFAPIPIDGYLIQSIAGSLNPTGFQGFAANGVSGWQSVAPSATALTELNLTSSVAFAAGSGQVLGSMFTASGTEDVTFQYDYLNRGQFNGSVIYKTQLAGDVNGDNVVNIFDINLVSSNWATSGPAGDGNYDGTVNIFDINFVSSHWGNTLGGGGAGITSVPEPSSLVLCGIGLVVGVGSFHLRRRRTN